MKQLKLTTVVAVCGVLLSAANGWAQDWPQWRGPNRDNKVTGFTEPKTWPKELTQKWKVPVGVGDASPVLVGDRVYVFTRESDEEVLRCLDADKGSEIWKDKYTAQAMTNRNASAHPGTRSSPAVADGKVCTFGVGGVVSCLDAAKGTVVWRKDTKQWPSFFTSNSPIIVDGKCIIHIGKDGGMRGPEGKGAIVAYDLKDGAEKWKWDGEGPGYASPVVLTVDKTKQFVTLTEKNVVGINLADGKLLWQIEFKARYNSVTPIVSGETVYYAGEGSGTVAVKIEKKDDKFVAKELWKKKDGPGKYNTPLLKDGLLFGITGRGNFYCMKAETGDVLWTDTTKHGDCGAVLDAGTVLLALTSDKQLVVFKPNDKAFTEVAKYKVADTDPWAYPIIAGNRIFVKDKENLILWTIE